MEQSGKLQAKELATTMDPKTGSPFLDSVSAFRAARDADKRFQHATQSKHDGGTFRSFDSSLISVEGLKRGGKEVQKVESPQLLEALQAIREAIKAQAGKPVVAVMG